MADNDRGTTTVPQPVSGNSSSPAAVQVAKVISWLSFSVGLPAIALAIYILRNVARGDSKVPVHVVLLLVSDILGFFGRPGVSEDLQSGSVSFSSSSAEFIFYFGLISNISLMVFIAQERHLLVACPQCVPGCSGFMRSPVVVLLVWAAPFAVLALAVLQYRLWFAASLLAPSPFLLFFAVDSWRALACSASGPPSPERRRTVWGISAIWANYTFLYTPFILAVLLEALAVQSVSHLGLVSHLLLYLGPLVDPFLYTFMTRGLTEVLQALPCCPHLRPKEDTRSRVRTVAETVETRL